MCSVSPERERGNGGLVTAGKSATNRTESLLGTVDGAGEVSGVAEKKQIAARLATAEGLKIVRFGRRKSLRIMCVERQLFPGQVVGRPQLLLLAAHLVYRLSARRACALPLVVQPPGEIR